MPATSPHNRVAGHFPAPKVVPPVELPEVPAGAPVAEAVESRAQTDAQALAGHAREMVAALADSDHSVDLDPDGIGDTGRREAEVTAGAAGASTSPLPLDTLRHRPVQW